MNLVPAFVPLVLHTGRPMLSTSAAAAATTIAVGLSADPILVGVSCMLIIEGSSVLLSLILPALASTACSTQLVGQDQVDLCQTHFNFNHPISSTIISDTPYDTNDALSAGGVDILFWVLSRLAIYFLSSVLGYLYAHMQAMRAKDFRKNASTSYQAMYVARALYDERLLKSLSEKTDSMEDMSTLPKLTPLTPYVLSDPRPTCDLWYNTWVFDYFHPPEGIVNAAADANATCRQHGCPPAKATTGMDHTQTGFLWLAVWVLGWLLIALIIESAAPIYDYDAYENGLNWSYHLVFGSIIALFAPYVLHCLFHVAIRYPLGDRPSWLATNPNFSSINGWQAFDNESHSAFLLLILVPSMAYVVSTIITVPLSGSHIKIINYALSMEESRDERQGAILTEFISTLAGSAASIIFATYFYFVGRMATDRLNVELDSSIKLANYTGVTVHGSQNFYNLNG
jgi:hypothetical protein